MAQDSAKLKTLLSAAPVVPVIIHDAVATAGDLAKALVAGGLTNLEVTLRTPNALRVIEEMAKVPGAVVGSGTVRKKADMTASVAAGCQFMVSPGAQWPCSKRQRTFRFPCCRELRHRPRRWRHR